MAYKSDQTPCLGTRLPWKVVKQIRKYVSIDDSTTIPTLVNEAPAEFNDDVTAKGSLILDSLSKLINTNGNAFLDIHKVNLNGTFTSTSAKTLENTGLSITIPANSIYSFTARIGYDHSTPFQVAISSNNSISWSGLAAVSPERIGNYGPCVSLSGYASTEITLYVFGAWQTANSNPAYLNGYYITLGE